MENEKEQLRKSEDTTVESQVKETTEGKVKSDKGKDVRRQNIKKVRQWIKENWKDAIVLLLKTAVKIFVAFCLSLIVVLIVIYLQETSDSNVGLIISLIALGLGCVIAGLVFNDNSPADILKMISFSFFWFASNMITMGKEDFEKIGMVRICLQAFVIFIACVAPNVRIREDVSKNRDLRVTNEELLNRIATLEKELQEIKSKTE